MLLHKISILSHFTWIKKKIVQNISFPYTTIVFTRDVHNEKRLIGSHSIQARQLNGSHFLNWLHNYRRPILLSLLLHLLNCKKLYMLTSIQKLSVIWSLTALSSWPSYWIDAFGSLPLPFTAKLLLTTYHVFIIILMRAFQKQSN